MAISTSKRPVSARGGGRSYGAAYSAPAGSQALSSSIRPSSASRPRTGTFVDRCDDKELSPQMESAREAAECRRLEEKKAAAKALAEQNRAYKARLASARQRGRDVKALSEEEERMRAEAHRRRQEEKSQRDSALAAENKAKMQRLKAARAHGRDEKALTAEEEEMRAEVERRRVSEKEQREAALAAENKLKLIRLRSARAQGRDSKALSKEEEEAREAARLRRLEAKAQEQKLLAAENKLKAQRLKQAKAQGRDAKALSPETEAARSAAERRRLDAKRAQKRELARQNHEMYLRLCTPEERERELRMMLAKSEKSSPRQLLVDEQQPLLGSQVQLHKTCEHLAGMDWPDLAVLQLTDNDTKEAEKSVGAPAISRLIDSGAGAAQIKMISEVHRVEQQRTTQAILDKVNQMQRERLDIIQNHGRSLSDPEALKHLLVSDGEPQQVKLIVHAS